MKLNQKQMDLTDRIVIETGLYANRTFKEIARDLGRHPATIAREIKTNRTFIPGDFPFGNDCRYARKCGAKNICDRNTEDCNFNCIYCKYVKCYTICHRYQPKGCARLKQPPYVCNCCANRRSCDHNRYMYSAKQADKLSRKRRSETRSGLRVKGDEFKALDALITKQIKLGQPLSHIYAEHRDELPIGLRSMYNYIDSGQLTIRNIDLRRKVGYRRRKRKNAPPSARFKCRQGRTYEDFQRFMKQHPDLDVVQMDTVKGSRTQGKTLLTMLFLKSNIMLLFLMPDCTSKSVVSVFNMINKNIGTTAFQMLFPVILTDNGSEFKSVNALERDTSGKERCHIFYCDPQASWQKAELEKNHEYIRYILPKGSNFSILTRRKVNGIMNHINSTKRLGIGNRSPYELVAPDDHCMKLLMMELKMDTIPPDDVHLMPDLIK